MDSLLVAHAAELTSAQLDEVNVIYRQAFSPQLRVPFAGLAVDGPSDLLLAALEGSVPVAFAAVMLLEERGWVFLRYYGVAAARRRQGLGLRFWQLLRPALSEAGWPGRIAFEVEDPDHAQVERERQVRIARIEFWRSCGCALLPIRGYVMPDINGLGQSEHMLLMAAGPDPGPGLQAAELAHLIRAIYEGRYGLKSGDSLVTSALASITG